MDRITYLLRKRQEMGAYRSLFRSERLPGGRILVGGEEFVDLSSNDYLGLSFDRSVKESAEKLARVCAGSGGSRLMTGSSFMHNELEEKIAVFKGKEAAMIFNSGYQANVGLISALCGKGDVVFSDKLAHASIVDGIRLSGARHFRYRHNDISSLETMLDRKRTTYERGLIVTESVFSMDGDIAPLKRISELAKKYSCMTFVDEAHATGVFGETGAGISEVLGLSGDIDILMGTFSKAFGGFGAYAAMNGTLKDYFINNCRSFIYSTSLPLHIISANLRALEVVRTSRGKREKLRSLSSEARKGLMDVGIETRGESQIVPMIIGRNELTMEFADSLRSAGFWVTPVRPPTVPSGRSRIRLSFSSEHGPEILKGLIGGIRKIQTGS